jgi:hypothetical protein
VPIEIGEVVTRDNRHYIDLVLATDQPLTDERKATAVPPV